MRDGGWGGGASSRAGVKLIHGLPARSNTSEHLQGEFKGFTEGQDQCLLDRDGFLLLLKRANAGRWTFNTAMAFFHL